MTNPRFPDELLRFITSTVPTYPAVELLVFLAREPDRSWTPAELVAGSPLTALPLQAASEYLAHFERSGLFQRGPDGRFRYAPASEELRTAVVDLVEAYHHKPVTLVRIVYSISTTRIQSFADSFKLKRE